jgi:hypothetical protein
MKMERRRREMEEADEERKRARERERGEKVEEVEEEEKSAGTKIKRENRIGREQSRAEHDWAGTALWLWGNQAPTPNRPRRPKLHPASLGNNTDFKSGGFYADGAFKDSFFSMMEFESEQRQLMAFVTREKKTDQCLLLGEHERKAPLPSQSARFV